jgi:hypothetical protein
MKYQENPDIDLKRLIEEGFIKPNTKVYASSDTSIEGLLNENGAIILSLNGESKLFPFPSGAARALVNLSVNGWKFWMIKENGTYTELSEIKKRFLTR